MKEWLFLIGAIVLETFFVFKQVPDLPAYIGIALIMAGVIEVWGVVIWTIKRWK